MSKKKQVIFQRKLSIAWGDMDALGHVNHARYFDYCQEARLEWLRSIGFYLTESQGPVVIQAGCTYFKPIVYPAELTLDSSIQTIGHTSMVIEHDLYQEKELMAQSTCKIVWIDYQQNISIPLPDKIRRFATEAHG